MLDRIEMYERYDFGVEFEFTRVKRDDRLQAFLNSACESLKIRLTHDASCETPKSFLGRMPIDFENDDEEKRYLSLFGRGRSVIGGEAVTGVIEPTYYPTWRKDFKQLLTLFANMGESAFTDRDSIHVHVNVGGSITLEELKRIAQWYRAYEQVFYLLGGFGRENRGVTNMYQYHRPIMYPPIIPMGRKFYPIYDFNDLLESPTRKDFFLRYGDCPACAGARYVAQRYSGLNFYSILVRESLEFRFANKTLNPAWLCAWISFCRLFTKFACSNIYYPPNTLYTLGTPIPFNDFYRFISSIGLRTSDVVLLTDVYKSTPQPVFDFTHRHTHLTGVNSFSSGTYVPKPIPAADIGKPLNTDVHELENIRRKLEQDVSNKAPKAIKYSKNFGLVQYKNSAKISSEYMLDVINNASNFDIYPKMTPGSSFAISDVKIGDYTVDLIQCLFTNYDNVEFTISMNGFVKTMSFRTYRTGQKCVINPRSCITDIMYDLIDRHHDAF